jgi:hypothetical protein
MKLLNKNDLYKISLIFYKIYVYYKVLSRFTEIVIVLRKISLKIKNLYTIIEVECKKF